MNTSLKKLAGGVVVLTVTLLAVGCESSYPESSEDAVYYFLANYRLHGKMRVCWPAGQEYAVGITKADAALQTELDKLRALTGCEAWWAKDDPRWHDTEAVAEHVKELAELAVAGALIRKEAFQAIEKALAKTPEGFISDPAKEVFIERLWKALEYEGEPLIDYVARLENTLTLRKQLFDKVQACAESFDQDADELRFMDAACQSEVDKLYVQFERRVLEERERFFELATRRMAELTPIANSIDKQKRREEYNLLDSERMYYRSRIRAAKRSLRELIKAEENKLDEFKEAAKPDQSKIDLHTRRIETLQTELEQVEQRGEPIVNPTGNDD